MDASASDCVVSLCVNCSASAIGAIKPCPLHSAARALLAVAVAEEFFVQNGITCDTVMQFVEKDADHPLWRKFLNSRDFSRTVAVRDWLNEQRRAAIAQAEGK